MRRRRLIGVGVGVLLVLLVIYLLPRTPAGRNWLLQQAQGALQQRGISLQYRRSSGNPWRGVTLAGVRVTSSGLTASLKTLQVGYSLPALLTGKLPLTIKVHQLTAQLDLSQLAGATSGSSPSGSGGGGPHIRPVLQNISADGVKLTINGVPYNAPRIAFSGLSVKQANGKLHLKTRLKTPQGQADVQAALTLSPFALTARISHADVRLARSYWPGAEGGTFSGVLHYEDEKLSFTGSIQGASASLIGIALNHVSGPFTLKDDVITAKLSGEALGGPVAAMGTVNIAVRKWQAQVSGQPALKDSALWLAKGRLPVSLEPIPMKGKTDVTLSLSGWRKVHAEGQAKGGGRLAGKVLKGLETTFSYATETGTQVKASASVGGAPASLSLTPEPKGYALTAQVHGLPLVQKLMGSVKLVLQARGEQRSGKLSAFFGGAALGREPAVNVRGTLSEHGWQFEASGHDGLGGKLAAAATLKGEEVQGKLSLTNLGVPYASAPLNAKLTADGPVRALPLRLTLGAAEPLQASIQGLRLGGDFRGSMQATLKGSRLEHLTGALGPLKLTAGNFDFSNRRGEVHYSLAATPLTGALQTEVALSSGTLTFHGEVSSQATLSTTPLHLSSLELGGLKGSLRLTTGPSPEVHFSGAKQGVTLDLAGRELEATFKDTPLSLEQKPLTLNGAASADMNGLLSTLALNLQAQGKLANLTLEGNKDITVGLALKPGFELGFLSLHQPLVLTGKVQLDSPAAQLSGTLGEMPVSISARTAGGIQGAIALGSPSGKEFRAKVELEPLEWKTKGELPLQLLAQAFGFDLTGTLDSDLSYKAQTYQGEAHLSAHLAGKPVTVQLEGLGEALRLEATTSLLGQSASLNLSGKPGAQVEATGKLNLGEYARGELTLSGPISALKLQAKGQTSAFQRADITLAAQPWQLEASLAEQQADLTLGHSHAVAKWGSGGWSLAAQVAQQARWRKLAAALDGQVQLGSQQPKGQLKGELKLVSSEQQGALALSGTLGKLQLTGALPPGLPAQAMGLTGLDLSGDINLNAQINLLSGQYALQADWQKGKGEKKPLQATIQGQGGAFQASLSGPGLQADYQSGKLSVHASHFALGSLLAAPEIAGEVSGDLLYNPADAHWQGALSLELNTPAQVSIALRGQGEKLLLAGSASSDEGQAKLTGSLLPSLDVQVEAGLARNYFTGQLSGTVTRPALHGQLDTQALNTTRAAGLTLPAQRLEVSGGLQGGPSLTLSGKHLQVSLEQGRWQGSFSLPFKLQKEAHLIQGTIQGALTEPALRATLSGPYLQGEVQASPQQAEADITLEPEPLLPVSLALDHPQVHLELSTDAKLNWQAKVQAAASYRQLPFTLQGSMSGQGLGYQGTLALKVEEEQKAATVPLSLSGQGAALSATVKLENVPLQPFSQLLPVALSGSANGSLKVKVGANASPPGVTGKLRLAGQAQGQPFDLNLEAPQEDHLSLAGEIAGVRLKAGTQLFEQAPVSLEVAYPAQGNQLKFAGKVGLGSTLTLQGTGSYRQKPLSVKVRYQPAASRASWQVKLPESSLQGTLQGSELRLSLDAAKNLFGLPLNVNARAHISDKPDEKEVSLTSLQATSTIAGQQAEVSLTGGVWPKTQLTGEMNLEPFLPQPVHLSLDGQKDGYILALQAQQFTLKAGVAPTLALETLSSMGKLELPGLLHLESNLAWSAKAGFSGDGKVTISPAPDTEVIARLEGRQELKAHGRMEYRGASVGTLALALSPAPWRDPALSGELKLDTEAADILPSWPTRPLRLVADLDLGGTLGAPSASGPAGLQGALSASGTLQATLQGTDLEADLALTGPGLTLTGKADRAGWQLSAKAQNLDLSQLLPQVESPSLSGGLRASQNWGQSLDASMTDIALTAAHSRVAGTLGYRRHPYGNLQLDVDLADLTLGAQRYRGHLSGPLRLEQTAGELTGTLKANNLGLADADWGLSGALHLAGSLNAPQLALRLQGEGSASGTLSASAAPAKADYKLSSTLKLGSVHSDFRLSLAQGRLQGQGGLGWQDYALSFAPAQNGQLLLQGDGALRSWRALVDVDEQKVSLQGDLRELTPQLGGKLNLSASWAAKSPWLSGELEALTVAGRSLGDITLTGHSEHTLELSGQSLQATVSLPQLNWKLEHLNLPLMPTLEAQLTGQGTLSTAKLAGKLSGTLQGESLALPFTANYHSGKLALQSNSPLFGGQASLQAALDSQGWSGQMSVTGVKLSSVVASFQGNLSGAAAKPQLAGALAVTQGENSLKGQVTASLQGVKLEQTLSSPLLSAPLRLSGEAWPQPNLTLVSADSQLTLSTKAGDHPLHSQGRLELAVGPAHLTLQAAQQTGEWLALSLSAPSAPGLVLQSNLPDGPLQSWLPKLLQDWRFAGAEKTSGSATVDLGDMTAKLDKLSWRSPGGTLSLSGKLSHKLSGKKGFSGKLQGSWQDDLGTSLLPTPANFQQLPFTLELKGARATLRSSSSVGEITARLDWRKTTLQMSADLKPGKGQAKLQLSYDPEQGPRGQVTLSNLALLEGKPEFSLSGHIAISGAGLSGQATIASPGGSIRATGALGWARLPQFVQSYVPQGTEEQTLELRVSNFQLSHLPLIAHRLPHLNAPVSGVAQLQEGTLIGQLVSPELSIAGRKLPGELDFNGNLQNIEVRAQLGRSQFRFSYDRRKSPRDDRRRPKLGGFFDLEQFPLQLPVEALLGPTGIEATITGAARIELPLGHLQDSTIRVASERIRLERNGVTTAGNVAFTYEKGALHVESATFQGAGSWQASGVIAPDQLDFHLSAENADFDPLLGLVPRLAQLGVGAQGSFKLSASGSLTAPAFSFQSSELKLELGGMHMHAQNTQAELKQGALSLSSTLSGLSPATGSLNLSATGALSLLPFDAQGVALTFSGAADIPAVGSVSTLQGELHHQQGHWRLNAKGELGQPFTLSGTLDPLHLQLQGKGLHVSAPKHGLAAADVDADLTLASGTEGAAVSGDLLITQAELGFEQGGEKTSDKTPDKIPSSPPDKPAGKPARSGPNSLTTLHFDQIHIQAPQQVKFHESFGSAEIAADLTLSGSAAAPQLAGKAHTLRGTFRFSGRDFTIDSATATFDPTQVIYPHITINASSSFDKGQVKGSAANYEFAAPQGASFTVKLVINGDFEEDASGTERLKLHSTLSSDATVQVTSRGNGKSAPRQLSDQELISLLTLGRLEPSTNLVGQGGFAGAVAGSALDTAVDVFVLSQLQDTLAKALGVDLFEIRTTPLSNLLDGHSSDIFGFSVRVGGYINKDLFASYRIGHYSDAGQRYTLSNEFSLRYDLAPLELNLYGGVNFDNNFNALPDFGLTLDYQFSPSFSLQAGTDLSSAEQSFHFGVGFRF
jgi:autotransporter translocation and assembly factor TamB